MPNKSSSNHHQKAVLVDGSLTQTLYSIVGIDDGLTIIIFGAISPIAIFILPNSGELTTPDSSIWISIIQPIREIGFSILLGGIVGVLFIWLTRFKNFRKELILLFFWCSYTSHWR